MNNRVPQIALRIALIKEEFSESDILEAVKLLEEHGSSSAVLAYLAGRDIPASAPNGKESKRKSKPIDEQRSKVVIGLEQKDPEKYQALSEFDALIRKGSVLPELDDIKRLGQRISKGFAPKRSRREAIGALMALIAEQPLDEIRKIVSSTLSSAYLDDKSNEYQELAQFIIRGKTLQAKKEIGQSVAAT